MSGKNIVGSFIPPVDSVIQGKDKTHWVAIATFLLVGLTIGAFLTTIIVNSIEINKVKEEVENGTK